MWEKRCNGEELKMGKRFPKYVVNPSDIVNQYGADTLRLYEMFMGALEASKPWSDEGVAGARRFIVKVWNYFTNEDNLTDLNDEKLTKIYHQTVKKVTNDYETLGFNTAISQMMIFMNAAAREKCPREYAEGFIKMFSCICPHVGEEIWSIFGHEETIAYEPWPVYDPEKCKDDVVEIGVQVNGKVRGRVTLAVDEAQDSAKEKALADPAIAKCVEGKTVVKVIYIPAKILNIVVK